MNREFDFNTIKIRDDVPAPVGRTRASGTLSSKLREMKVGQSFEIPSKKRNVVVSVANTQKIPIVTRTTDADKGIVTVWRVEGEPIGEQINAATEKKSQPKGKKGKPTSKRFSPLSLSAAPSQS